MQIDIDFEVFKALTVRRENESHSYNEVLRELLGLGQLVVTTSSMNASTTGVLGRTFGGRFLPNGTLFRATYKQQDYAASVVNGELISQDGARHSSASAAARAITNTNVNGLTFWQIKRPSDGAWRKLVALPKTTQ